jgi:hypothetical protein
MEMATYWPSVNPKVKKVCAAPRQDAKCSSTKSTVQSLLAVGFSFFGVTVVWANTFQAFVVYEMLALFLVVGIYSISAVRERTSGSILMTAGAVLTIAAAAIQATLTCNFHCVWTFDHNGIFHLVQLVAVVCLVWIPMGRKHLRNDDRWRTGRGAVC